METIIVLLVGGALGLVVLRVAFDEWFTRARRRKALTRGQLEPALRDDVAPRALHELGLTEPFRIGEAVGGRGTLAGVEGEGVVDHEVHADAPVRHFILTLRFEGLALFTEGLRRDPGDVEIGDPALDDRLVVKGDPHAIAARLDAWARPALVAALGDGWRAEGDRLVRRIAEPELGARLATGLEAARRLLARDARDTIARLERTAATDPSPRMRRLALAALMHRYPREAATARAIAACQHSADPLLRWLAARASSELQAWLRTTADLLHDPSRAAEVAALVDALDVAQALPALGAAEAHHAGGTRAAISRARAALAARASARGQGAAGALSVSERGAGDLTLGDGS